MVGVLPAGICVLQLLGEDVDVAGAVERVSYVQLLVPARRLQQRAVERLVCTVQQLFFVWRAHILVFFREMSARAKHILNASLFDDDILMVILVVRRDRSLLFLTNIIQERLQSFVHHVYFLTEIGFSNLNVVVLRVF